MNSSLPFVVAFILGAALSALFFMSISTYTKTWQQAAIQHGAAEWKVNPDGTTEFKWKEKP